MDSGLIECPDYENIFHPSYHNLPYKCPVYLAFSECCSGESLLQNIFDSDAVGASGLIQSNMVYYRDFKE